MALEDLPKTLYWQPADACWVPSTFSATGVDEAAAHLVLLDQRQLPHALEYVDCFSSGQVCDAIANLTVRGAPAIGVAGAFAVVLWAKNEWPQLCAKMQGESSKAAIASPAVFAGKLKARAQEIAQTRPTAVNLAWGVDQMVDCARKSTSSGASIEQAVDALEQRAVKLAAADEQICRAIGEHGLAEFASLSQAAGRPLRVQTHCNAGSLATVRFGTATAVIYAAFGQGLIEKVWVDETRPVDQGARLTAWELGVAGVPYMLACDDMAGSLMQHGLVDAVIVGADRICANGDVANKIGTYQLAVLAKVHRVPFFVAAPTSTFDESLASGDEIVIEQRDPQEVRCMPYGGEWLAVAPQGCDVYNPAFDVTPHGLITKIISEKGAVSAG